LRTWPLDEEVAWPVLARVEVAALDRQPRAAAAAEGLALLPG
jgi:hypothetical protein